MNLKEIAKQNHLDYLQLYRRVKQKGMTIDDAIADCQKNKESGEENLQQIAVEKGIKYATLYKRVKRLGWTIEEAVAGKKRKKEKHREVTPEDKSKPMSFRPTNAQAELIYLEIEASGETLQDWLLDAVIAKLEGRIIPK